MHFNFSLQKQEYNNNALPVCIPEQFYLYIFASLFHILSIFVAAILIRAIFTVQHFITRYRFYTALALFLSFAATQFPFELFHSHSPSVQCAGQNNNDGFCHHKSHLGTRNNYCWACTIHVEKTYMAPAAASVSPPLLIPRAHHSILLKNDRENIEHTSLRGPPLYTV